MTQKEFEERTGLTVDAHFYTEIEKVYMEAGQYVNKDMFYKEWPTAKDSKIVAGMHDTIRQLQRKLSIVEHEVAQRDADKSKLVDFLLERAQKFGDEELLTKAIEMVGHAEVIRRKLAANLALWERDHEYIKDNLE